MFGKKPKPDDLQARLQSAEERLESLRRQAIIAARDDPDKLASLSEQASGLEFEINALRAAIKQAEHEVAEAEAKERQKADRLQREATSRELHRLADGLEKAIVPVPDVLLGLKEAVDAVLPIIGPNGFPQLLENLHSEIPNAIALFAAEIRARAVQTLEGRAPATLPAPPVLTVIEEEPLVMPTIQVFALERLSWLDDKGLRPGCGPFQIVNLPVKAAKIALERGLAIALDSDRYKQMRETAKKVGWPHLVDSQKTFDLDRDPNTTEVFSSGGKKVREEATFEVMDKGPPRKASWIEPAPKEPF